MAAKDIDPNLDGTIDPISIEAGTQDWIQTCGVCHVGGGQLEYDRDANPYSATSPAGDYYMFEYPALGNQDPIAVTPGYMSATNKAEVDCLMCHLDYSTIAGGANGRHLLQTWGCGPGNPIGPMNDPTCSDPNVAGPIGAGTGFDMYNRNLGLKGRNMEAIASMGLGAVGTIVPDTSIQTGFRVAGITWPNLPVINGSTDITRTPNSQNCAPCHARDENTPSLPGMMGMKFGYGNYLLSTPPGNAVDYDDPNGDGSNANDVTWNDFGCKTGMGKRTHKIGVGPNSQWGMSMFNTMFGLGKNPGDPVLTETIPVNNPMMIANGVTEVQTKERIPDADVHDMGGIHCATCHYALGSDQAAYTVGSGGGSITFPAGEHHHVDYPAETIKSMDHQFAQGDSYPDTKGKNNLDGTVYCGMCHIDRTHPKVVSGELNPPTPTHAAFPAFHIDKIACATCHIPEVYGAPGRLKYRDWTAGIYKGGFRNMLDWNFDLITGSHKTLPVVRKWLTKFGKKQIYPVLPSVMPIWVEVVSSNATGAEVDFDGTPFPVGDLATPVKHRDTTIAARALLGDGYDIRLNGGNAIPLFDGFTLGDSWEIDTKAEIDAMLASFLANTEANAKKLKLFQADFDVTHGVVDPQWALGGPKRGGCVSCHSSANPSDPNYSSNSVAFFEGAIQPLNNAGMGIGGYEMIKNWFALFADYDCVAMCDPMTMNDAAYFDATNNPISGAPCTWNKAAGGMFDTIDECVGVMTGTFDAVMGFPAGTSQMMGMWDGIAGLQGFTIRETTTGSLDADGNGDYCNPFAGPASMSPFAGYSVNACVAAGGTATCENMGPSGMGFNIGTCSATSFRAGGMCSDATGNANADCNGTLTDANGDVTRNPFGLLYSRAEVRSHFKINLQQSQGVVGNPGTNKVTWPVGGEQNPGNASHVNSWDQANYCFDYSVNPMNPAVVPCSDGGVIATVIPANAFLGYANSYVDVLKTAQTSSYLDNLDAVLQWQHSATVSNEITFHGENSKCPSASCTYTWDYGDTNTGTGVTATHTYAAPGQYDATLTVTDDQTGYYDTETKTVTAQEILANPDPTVTVVAVGGLDAQLTITKGENNLSRLRVVWGDGSTSYPAAANPDTVVTHTYGASGTHNLTINIMDTAGNRYTETPSVVIP